MTKSTIEKPEGKSPWMGKVPLEVLKDPFNPEAHGYQVVEGTPSPVPLEKPPFTLNDIRKAIPPHCLKRSTALGLFYTVQNIGMCAVLFYFSTWIGHNPFTPRWSSWILWPAYWFVQGAYMWGIWLIGHDCLHGAISEYSSVNDSLGLILHTILLTPYFGLKITHLKHHMNTGSAENEQTYVPTTRSDVKKWWFEALENSTIFNFVRLIIMLSIGVLPLYFVFNIFGPKKYKGKNANHFSPTAIFVLPKQRNEIVLQNIVYLGWIGVLYHLCVVYSFTDVVFYYGIPVIINNAILFIITYLNHNDTYVPYFRGEDWNWLRGSLSSVDRSWGKWLDVALHHSPESHVCHHFFPQLPFYHFLEANEAISKVVGKYRLVDKTPIWKALWRTYINCKFVEDEGPVAFFKSKLAI